jgi:hypothetical protein
MNIDEFIKVDDTRGMNLDDVFGSSTTPTEEADSEEAALGRILELLKPERPPLPAELEGYYPYRLLIGDRYFYPRKGTLRLSSPYDVIFVDELYTDDEDVKPTYMTVPLKNVVGTTWAYDDDAPGNEEMLKAA